MPGRRRTLALAVLLVAALALAVVWRVADTAVVPEGAERELRISADPVVQAEFERAWELIHRGDDARAYGLAKRVVSVEPENAWARFTVYVAAPDEESAGHLEAAARRATGATPQERLIRLCSQAMVGLGAATDWEALERVGEPRFLPIAKAMHHPGIDGQDYEGRIALWNAAREAVPESARPWDALVELAMSNGDNAGASALLTEALARFPGSPALLSRRVGLALDEGTVDVARDAAERALELAPGDRGAREGLAVAVLHLGDIHRFTQEADLLLREGTVAERGEAAARLARATFGVGRLAYTERLLQRCRDLAVEGDTPDLGLYCELEAFGVHFLLDDLPGMARDVEQLGGVVVEPGMSSLLQPVIQERILLNRGLVAARRGELEEATRARERLEDLGSRARDVSLSGSLLFLDRAIREARQQRDQAFVDDQVGTNRSGGLCLAARHLEAVGDAEDARVLYRRIVAGDVLPGAHGFSLFARAFAAVRLAEISVDADPAAAADALSSFSEHWSDADVDHPLVLRAAVVRARLASR